MIERYRHAQLLVMLVVLLLANPFIDRTVVFIDVLLALTLVSAVIASTGRRSQAAIVLALAALVLALSWYREYSGIESVTIYYSVAALCLFGFVTATLLTDLFRKDTSVSADTICGALAAYLLLGVCWAFAFALLEVVEPGSIVGLAEDGTRTGYAEYLGFSFVTLTTLGYGNIVPGTAQAEALASGEAIVGQVYLTVLVARLVALNIASARST